MTKILYITGGDYSASDFEKLRDAGKLDPNHLWVVGEGEYITEREYFEYKAYQFGAVDPNFIKFVKDNQDYDASKHANFYVVEP